MPIDSLRFYHKGFKTVVPINNVESDGSDDDGGDRDLQQKDRHVLAEINSTDSNTSGDEDESSPRWPRNCSPDSTVILPSPEHEENKVVRKYRITKFSVQDRFSKENREPNRGQRVVSRRLFDLSNLSADGNQSSMKTSSPAEGHSNVSMHLGESMIPAIEKTKTAPEEADSQYYCPVLTFSGSDDMDMLATSPEKKENPARVLVPHTQSNIPVYKQVSKVHGKLCDGTLASDSDSDDMPLQMLSDKIKTIPDSNNNQDNIFNKGSPLSTRTRRTRNNIQANLPETGRILHSCDTATRNVLSAVNSNHIQNKLQASPSKSVTNNNNKSRIPIHKKVSNVKAQFAKDTRVPSRQIVSQTVTEPNCQSALDSPNKTRPCKSRKPKESVEIITAEMWQDNNYDGTESNGFISSNSDTDKIKATPDRNNNLDNIFNKGSPLSTKRRNNFESNLPETQGINRAKNVVSAVISNRIHIRNKLQALPSKSVTNKNNKSRIPIDRKVPIVKAQLAKETRSASLQTVSKTVTEPKYQTASDLCKNHSPVNSLELSESEENASAEMWREGDIEEKVLDPHPPFTTPQEEKDPLDYFSYYFDEAILSLILEQTNLYFTQENINNNAAITIHELKIFLGIILYMGVVSLPAIEDYWNSNTYVKQVADVMSYRRFQKIRSHTHFVDNSDEPGTDPFRKVRPILNHMRAKINTLEQESTLSADEGMVGYKGSIYRTSPALNGALNFLDWREQVGCFMTSFFTLELILSLKKICCLKRMGVGAMAIIALSKCIKNPKSSSLTFDNWYTGLPLINYLQSELNTCSLGTIKSNRMENCPLKPDKDLLRTQARGYVESQVSKTGVVVMKWLDNKVVSLAGTRAGVQPLGAVLRWDKASKSRVLINIPRAILTYNSSMGGVDLSDQYRTMLSTPTRAKRWYFPLFGFTLDLAMCNAYLLYKRDCGLLGVKAKFQNLKDFRLSVSNALMAPSQRSRGRPSLRRPLSQHEVRRPILPRPVDAIRTDGYNHWIVSDNKQHRCRFCSALTRCKCSKCEVYLCFVVSKDAESCRNCFTQFHIQKNIVRKKKACTPDNTLESDAESEYDIFADGA
ncbi:PiggyBac transposable element-derived protein 3 [Frankliniella fusca]|uniref:PiggyBac transposable element-derived protein 3 n=1 Tax=Frankliniella fusca TaxID=407009 RepID=A0AAE1L928_9NEOP|nr:PiggyBac transposable element-derived protein 3 [Frankliniella fusca]